MDSKNSANVWKCFKYSVPTTVNNVWKILLKIKYFNIYLQWVENIFGYSKNLHFWVKNTIILIYILIKIVWNFTGDIEALRLVSSISTWQGRMKFEIRVHCIIPKIYGTQLFLQLKLFILEQFQNFKNNLFSEFFFIKLIFFP